MSNLHYFHRDWIRDTDEALEVDLCVYGGTAGGVIAAVTATKLGKSVVLLHPGKTLGGMTTGGLGWTDHGRRNVIGGLSRQFYRDVGALYGKDEEWFFEPRVAQRVIDRYVADHALAVRDGQYLDHVETEGNRIARIAMLGGLTVRAKCFVDATYEGDLLAKAGVSYTVGREANAQYGEQLNGVQCRETHQFSHPVDPYVTPGDPSSGLLPWIEPDDLTARQGEGDRRVQAYNFRVCMTDDPGLKIAWEKPAGFDPMQYELATRWFNSEKDAYNEPLREPMHEWVGVPVPCKFDVLPNRTPAGHYKTDTNNHGPVSSDFIGANHDYPEADYQRREQIFQQHVTYQRGFYWHVANCPDIPKRYREAYSHWGLAADQFEDTEHWPHQLYVREARRMVSDYVITEHDCRGAVRPDDPVGMASYTMDSHNCSRFVKVEDGVHRVLNEGDVQVPPTDPYPVSYRAVIPKRGECGNLFVPVCISASHIAFGSARMEPVFMLLGESVARAAAIAIDNGCDAHDVAYDELGPELEKAEQVMAMPGG